LASFRTRPATTPVPSPSIPFKLNSDPCEQPPSSSHSH
jgi:hypothetical protein